MGETNTFLSDSWIFPQHSLCLNAEQLSPLNVTLVKVHENHVAPELGLAGAGLVVLGRKIVVHLLEGL